MTTHKEQNYWWGMQHDEGLLGVPRIDSRSDMWSVALCLHLGVTSFVVAGIFVVQWTARSTQILLLQNWKPDPKPADLKYALKWIHTLYSSVPGCDFIDIVCPPIINCQSWKPCMSGSFVGHPRALSCHASSLLPVVLAEISGVYSWSCSQAPSMSHTSFVLSQFWRLNPGLYGKPWPYPWRLLRHLFSE